MHCMPNKHARPLNVNSSYQFKCNVIFDQCRSVSLSQNGRFSVAQAATHETPKRTSAADAIKNQAQRLGNINKRPVPYLLWMYTIFIRPSSSRFTVSNAEAIIPIPKCKIKLNSKHRRSLIMLLLHFLAESVTVKESTLFYIVCTQPTINTQIITNNSQ